MPFPVIKLFAVLVKQLSKPLSTYVKRKAKENYFLRTYLCIPPAQVYHRLDVKLKMWVAGIKGGTNFKVQPLTEEMAINTGAELLGEISIFTTAASLVAFEWWRQKSAYARKEKQNEVCVVQLRNDVNALQDIIAAQTQSIERLATTLTSASKSRTNENCNL